MRWRVLPWVSLFLLAALGAVSGAAGDADPRWAVDDKGYLTMRQLPAVLEDEVIADHLTSGLTTSFVLHAELHPGGKRGNAAGGARIDVRYELWDELFQVIIVTQEGTTERHVLASAAELRAWWRTLEVGLLDVGSAAQAAGRRVQVTLTVVPFSRSEQRDAQRWLTEAAARTGSEGASRAPKKNQSTGGIAELLMATSIGRRALLTRRWLVVLDSVERQRARKRP